MQEYKLYINVINEMIRKIEDSIKNISQDEFIKNSTLLDATLMRLQVIGENIGNIPSNIKKEEKHVKWKKFEKLRNIISHKYASVDYGLIWDFIKNNLRELKRGLSSII
jgi:uncharacterized protein with HEPN domain